MKILVTGGAGFIGLALARRILESDPTAEIVLVDNFARGKDDNDLKQLTADPRVTVLTLDLTDPASYQKLGNGYDHVHHLAAVNGTDLFYKIPHEVMRVNMLTLIYMLEWFRKYNAGGKFLFTSSNEAYAGALEAFGTLPIPTPEDVPLVIADPYNPRWTYATTKLAGELFVIWYAEMYKFRAVIVRPHNFYGPRAGYNHVIPQFSLRIRGKTDPFSIFGADETRSFCYIDDAVEAMQMLMHSEKTDRWPIETVHIGSGEEIAMRDLADIMFSISEWRPEKIEMKDGAEGSVKQRRPHIGKIEKLIGWRPKTSLKDGLRKTMEWYGRNPSPDAS